MIIEKVRQFVEAECRKPTSKYGYGPYDSHFVPMVGYAKKLAVEMGADVEIVEIAGWLHDIGSIMVGRDDHHITGAEIARQKLKEFGYPADKTALVANCILHHRGSQKLEAETLEEQIIIEADSISCFDNLEGIFRAALVNENKSEEEARISVVNKMNNKWNQLKFEKSKEIIRPKYDAFKILFEK